MMKDLVLWPYVICRMFACVPSSETRLNSQRKGGDCRPWSCGSTCGCIIHITHAEDVHRPNVSTSPEHFIKWTSLIQMLYKQNKQRKERFWFTSMVLILPRNILVNDKGSSEIVLETVSISKARNKLYTLANKPKNEQTQIRAIMLLLSSTANEM